MGLSLYLLGICATAVIFQGMSSQASKIEPSFLVLGGTIGLLVGSSPILLNLLLQTSYYPISPLIILPFAFLLSIVGIRIACEFPRRKSSSHQRVLLSRISTLIGWLVALLALTVIWINNSSFPGINAASVVREQWANQEFNGYKGVVETIKTCQPIIKQVGRVKYVAPTSGKNYVISDHGSSGHRGEFTLEVVGEQGIGVTNFNFHIDTVVSSGQLTYQGKTQEIVCRV
ncbi:hypothetical protein [Nostoc sp. TCL26-01]|uniref:hypothetical protein n=1 Tax=Nostoc sp. TCL26-01 TaxID=2576904 RepID=UPI0015B9F859|nr:hypothetical protein [Nostoc sp. TCL26-01]QLE56409.1 hypothetical protein FD725_13320 [Nostoc sp. TCL26-01]